MENRRKWEQTNNGNFVSQRKGFYLSYNPARYMNFEEEPETAICIGNVPNKKFFILLGDFRDLYDKCETLAECLNLFKEYAFGRLCSFSNTVEEAEDMLVTLGGNNAKND